MELLVKNPAEWHKSRQKLATDNDLWQYRTTAKLDALEKEWERLHFLAYHACCKANDRPRRIKLAQEYCTAMNELLEQLLKEIFWSKLSS